MQIFAHRGASAYAPENTMAAFLLAHAMNASGIELDVQLSKDGVIVICHDYTIARTSNGNGLISQLCLAELRSYDFGSWFHADFRSERIVTLDEFLQWFSQTEMLLNIEIKNGPIVYSGIEAAVIKAIKRYDLIERAFVSSFYHPSLARIKHLCPELKTGALFCGRPLDPLDFCRQIPADYLHPDWESVDSQWAAEAKRQGIRIHTFTINQREQFDYIAKIGVDAIFTDYPDIWQG